MHTRTTRETHLQDGSRTALFEGAKYGSGVTFFWIDAAPGEGPPLHRHPYSETWAVLAGRVVITVDDDDLEATEGDIIVVAPGSPHRFRAVGEDRLHMMCIHDSPELIEETLEG